MEWVWHGFSLYHGDNGIGFLKVSGILLHRGQDYSDEKLFLFCCSWGGKEWITGQHLTCNRHEKNQRSNSCNKKNKQKRLR